MNRGRLRTLVAVVVVFCALCTVGVTTAESNATSPSTGIEGAGNATTATDNTSLRADPVPDGQAKIEGGNFDSHDSIVVTQEYRLTPDRPGEIDVQWHFRIPDRVSDVKTRLPPDARNVRTSRFTRTQGDIYEWPGDTTTASITFTLLANETTEKTGPESADGRLKFADTGEWALIRRPQVTKPGYRHPEGRDPGVTIRNQTAGEGVVGSALLYLGPHEIRERTAHGQRFQLVVPQQATLTEDPEEILDSVADASDRFRVGDRDKRVLMIAAPTSVSWGVLGLQTGDRDFYVQADQQLDAADNTWIHEYVHTRQDFRTERESEWFFEATAEYYAGQLTLEQDRIDYQQFRNYLARGQNRRFADVRLVDPSTWRSNGGNYFKGALVVADLDRRIRTETDGSGTFQDVFRRMNRKSSPATHREFVDFVEAAGGGTVVDPAKRFTETTSRPETWSQEHHGEVFGALPPRFTYDLAEARSDGMRVRGPYRNGTLGATELVAGETVVFDVAVANVGGSAGEYDLAVTVDGDTVATRTNRLESGNSTTETVEYTFDQPGQYTVSTGEDSRTVRVREPATPVIGRLSTDRSEVTAGEQLTVTATVENPENRPGKRTVTISQDGSVVTDQQVRLGPQESTDMTATVTLAQPGAVRFESGEQTVTVTVRQAETPSPTPTATSTDGESTGGVSGPGFGPLAVVSALCGLCVLLLVRQRVQ